MVRTCYALRPEGIQWVYHDDGTPSFKLEDLTKANQLDHGQAHDAVSDVKATIALAKLIKQAQPKLYHYYFEHRSKAKLSSLIDCVKVKPLLHVSGMFGAARACTSLIAPIAFHPSQKNAVIAIDLNQSCEPLLTLTAQEIHTRLYTKKSDLDGQLPIPVKLIHLNKCPMLAPASHMTPEVAKRCQFDIGAAKEQLLCIQTHREIRQKLLEVYQIEREHSAGSTSTNDQLYSGGFFSTR